LFVLQTASKEANQSKAQFEALRPQDKLKFSKAHPDVMFERSKAKQFTKMKTQVAKARVALNNPKVSASTKAQANKQISVILEAARKLQKRTQ
jgi:hypothetical protein